MNIRSWLDSIMPDYSGVGQATPEYIGRENIVDPFVNAGVSLATLPKRAFGASETMRTEGTYNPAPIVEAATLPLGTGGVAGVSMVPGEMALGAGILRPKPVIGGYHGTGSPTDFSSFQLPPVTHDLGIHTTIDPNVATQYARNKPSFSGSLEHLQPPDPRNTAFARTIPVVADIQNPLKVPFDAGKWNQAENVIQPLEEAVAKGGRYQLPRGILEDMRNIGKSDAMWQDQFAPMIKDRGYDSLFYPHGTDYGPGSKYNTFMTFDPAQTVPRLSPQGQQLIRERGIHNPMQRDLAYDEGGRANWSLPKGILQKIEDPEPAAAVKEIVEARQKKWQEDYDKKYAIDKSMQTFQELEQKFKNQEISGEEFWKEYDKIFNAKQANQGKMLEIGMKQDKWVPETEPLKPVPKGMLAKADADLAAGVIDKAEHDKIFKFVSANTPESGVVPEYYKKLAHKK